MAAKARPGHHQIAGGLVLRRGAGEDRWSQGAGNSDHFSDGFWMFSDTWLNLEKRKKKADKLFLGCPWCQKKNKTDLSLHLGMETMGFSVRFSFNLCVLEPWDRTRNHWISVIWGMAGMRTGNIWEHKSKLMVLDDPGLNCMHIITISTYTVLNIVYLTCYTI